MNIYNINKYEKKFKDFLIYMGSNEMNLNRSFSNIKFSFKVSCE